MFTDPSGESFKDWWNKNIAEPFMREVHSVFGYGQGGWQVGYNSSSGFFTNPTYNGTPWGASAYYNPSNGQTSIGNGSGGFHDNSSSVRINNIISKSVAQAEQNARGEYWGQRALETIWKEVIDIPNVMFGSDEDDNTYGIYNGQNSYRTQKNIITALSNSTSLVGDYIGYAKRNMPLNSFEKFFKNSSTGLTLYSAFSNSNDLYNNPNIESGIDLGLDLINLKSFPAWLYATWFFKIAPKGALEINYEGYRNGDLKK